MVATPIGNARDITLRTLDILASADVLAAEDTRSLRKLMAIHGIAVDGRPVLAYHDHNGAKMRPRLLTLLGEGKSVAYAPEAGTPTVSDPGLVLAKEARAAGYGVTAAPGASAVLSALCVAGLPTDRFLFSGFLPSSDGPRRKALSELAGVPATLVFYESPHRIAATLATAGAVLGGDRPAALCRELTKRFEEVRSGTLAQLHASVVQSPPKGEIVLVIGKGGATGVSELEIETAIDLALATMSVRDTADTVAAQFGVKRREIYQKAMARATARKAAPPDG